MFLKAIFIVKGSVSVLFKIQFEVTDEILLMISKQARVL